MFLKTSHLYFCVFIMKNRRGFLLLFSDYGVKLDFQYFTYEFIEKFEYEKR